MAPLIRCREVLSPDELHAGLQQAANIGGADILLNIFEPCSATWKLKSEYSTVLVIGSIACAAAAAALCVVTWYHGSRPAGQHHEDVDESTVTTKHKVFLDPDVPVDSEGRTYHLQTKPGEVANRILSVGDTGRASRIGALMSSVRTYTSSRGFVTHTGLYRGVQVSVVATGMGYPMADFVVRECRTVVTGPMAVLRFGTCGGLGTAAPGTVVVAGEGSVLVRRDPDAIGDALADGSAGAPSPSTGSVGPSSPSFPYTVSRTVFPHAGLTSMYLSALRRCIEPLGPAFPVRTGMDATADSFYSSQGRKGRHFFDRNDSLVSRLSAAYPSMATLQMETFHVFDLARASVPEAPVFASAAAIVLVNRGSATIVAKEDMQLLELHGGKAALDTLATFDLERAN